MGITTNTKEKNPLYWRILSYIICIYDNMRQYTSKGSFLPTGVHPTSGRFNNTAVYLGLLGYSEGAPRVSRPLELI